MKYKIFSMLLCMCLFSCTKEPESSFDIDIRNLFALFEEEALQRGINIEIDDFSLTTSLENFEDTQAIGYCRSYSNGNREIALDNSFWQNANSLQKEFLLFHELGHCILNLEHNDSSDNNGICLSIMQSGLGTCNLNYSFSNRENMLDELFQN